ncbi:fam-m protein [Plasmodium malariae]|uniref:Fam-m protein n=1 Tax=Plasmodium malariae TaxID=5858 RepID=A0A1D3PAB6_PLAMA|nr:fam-m protein [Plasmodium malariae]SCN11985.1 fam-m protein [Plasmodium malariae]
MELRINKILFNIISAFSFLTGIFFFKNDGITFKDFLYGNCIMSKSLDTRNYRLLTKYNQDKDSNNIYLNERFPINGANENKDIYNNKLWYIDKNKKCNKNMLNKAQYYTEVVDYNNGIFDGKHFHFEKRLIKKKDYDHFLEKQRRIQNIALKKIKLRNYRFIGTILLLFFLLGIGLPILQGFKLLQSAGDSIKELSWVKSLWSVVESWLDNAKYHFFIISYGIIIFILFVILLITLPKILRNNEKYNKLKLMME